MAIRFSDTILSGSLKISGSYTLPNIDTGSTGVVGQFGINNEVPHFYSSQGWQPVSGSKFTPIPPPSANVEYLVIAGGGGGGDGYYGGGGGAGGYLSGSLSSVESGSLFTIVVGSGGAGATGQSADGANGTTSSIAGASITTIAAIGGGGGASRQSDPAADGGSGGGAAMEPAYGGVAGSGTVGQGNDGGVGANQYGAGGGGAGEAGIASSGNGGSGSASSITGTSIFRAGGGGGGGDGSSYPVGSGGLGGGGAGSVIGATPTAGTANTGGGGGGGGGNGTDGAAGGSGVVVLALPTASLSATGGVRTFFNDRVAHTFNTSGTFSVSGPVTHTHGTLDVFGDSSCLAFYQLDGNANDTSGNYNGTASNITYSQGYINNAGTFNGSNAYIDLPTSIASSLRTAAAFGVSFWFKRDGNQTDTSYGGRLIHILNDIYINVNVETNNTIKAIIVTSSSAYPETISSVVPDGVWNHIVFTGDNNGIRLYLNNSLADSDTWDGTFMTYSNSNYKFNRLGYSGSGITYLKGEMDQVRIFNRALTATEVLTLYKE